MFREIVVCSPTVRAQFERIAATPGLEVHVGLSVALPPDRQAQTEFRRSMSAPLSARVEIATPLRLIEYAEWLAHELEHVLEQIEGVHLAGGSPELAGGVSRLADGAYETERAHRAGRQASLEVKQAGG